MKRLWIVPFAAALLVGCSEEKPPQAVRPALYVVVQPERSEHLGRFAGNIEARYESTLGFRVPGRIVRRFYDVGAVVKQGDIWLTWTRPISKTNCAQPKATWPKCRHS